MTKSLKFNWQLTKILTDNCEKGSLPHFPFPFLAIFSPNREPVHRLYLIWNYGI